jgi:hypothetical protein
MTTSAETALGGLYDLETSLYPRPVLCKGVAERVPFASESQARGRGSTRPRDTTIASKSGHMRFVHSRCYPGFFLGGYVLDRCRDLRGIIEM